MISNRFDRLSGLILCAAGALYLLDSLLDGVAPQQNPGLGTFVPMLGLIGFPAFWLSLERRDTPLSLLAFCLSMLGLSGLVALTFVVNRALPDLAGATRAELFAAVGPEFQLIGLVFLISAGLLAALTWPAGRSVRLGSVLYLLGAVSIVLRPVLPSALAPLDGVLIGTALMIWGRHLLWSPAVAQPA